MPSAGFATVWPPNDRIDEEELFDELPLNADELPLNDCGSNDRPLDELLLALSPNERDDRPDDWKLLELSLRELNVRLELLLPDDERLDDPLPDEKLRDEGPLPLFDDRLL